MARVALACLVGLAAQARAQIRVIAPDWLVHSIPGSGRIEGSTATFGAPYYGQRILGRLVYGESRQNHTHCRDDDYVVADTIHETEESETGANTRLINIVIVRRGKCSFVTKVKVAADKGAHAVIIVDQEDSKMTSNDIKRVIVADDGYGEQVVIPSVLVSKDEGRMLIDAVKKPQSQVIVELAWNVPTDHVVALDLWMSSASRESGKFLNQFAEKRRQLNDCMKFVPHYHVFSMRTSMDFYNDLCTDSTAQYCAEDPDGSGPLTGKDVLEEDVRQLCIHELTKDVSTKWVRLNENEEQKHVTIEYSAMWWSYIEIHLHECPLDAANADDRFGTVCSEKLMRHIGIDVDSVNRCMQTTKEEKLAHERDNVAWSPRALRINGWRYSGTLDPELVTRAICAGFAHEPPACGALLTPVNPFARTEVAAKSVGLGSFVATVLVVIGFVLAALLLYKRSLTKHIQMSLREEVMLEVQSQMDSYKQLPQ